MFFMLINIKETPYFLKYFTVHNKFSSRNDIHRRRKHISIYIFNTSLNLFFFFICWYCRLVPFCRERRTNKESKKQKNKAYTTISLISTMSTHTILELALHTNNNYITTILSICFSQHDTKKSPNKKKNN